MQHPSHAGRGAISAVALLLGAALLSGCDPAPPPMPLDQLNPQQTRGHAVFQARCARCHYERKDAPLRGPSLAALFKRKSLPSGAPANDERVTNVIRRGRNTMPAFTANLDDQALDDLLAYLHTI